MAFLVVRPGYLNLSPRRRAFSESTLALTPERDWTFLGHDFVPRVDGNDTPPTTDEEDIWKSDDDEEDEWITELKNKQRKNQINSSLETLIVSSGDEEDGGDKNTGFCCQAETHKLDDRPPTPFPPSMSSLFRDPLWSHGAMMDQPTTRPLVAIQDGTFPLQLQKVTKLLLLLLCFFLRLLLL